MLSSAIPTERKLLSDTHRILEILEIPFESLRDVEELTMLAPTIFVQIFEKIFHTEIQGIYRYPECYQECCHNIKCVIDSLSDEIGIDLDHIHSDAILDGDICTIFNLLSILSRMLVIKTREDSDRFFQATSDDSISTVSSQGEHSTASYASTREDLRSSNSTFYSSDMNSSNNSHDKEDNSSSNNSWGGSKSSRSSSLGLSKDRSSILANNSYSETSDTEENDRQAFWRPPYTLPSGYEYLRMSSEDLARLSEHDLKPVIKRIEASLRIENKLHQAKHRREYQTYQKIVSTKAKNNRTEDVSAKALHRRWMDDLECEERSFQLNRSGYDSVMMQKIYRAHLRKLHQWRVEELQDIQSGATKYRQETLQHLDNLSKLFNDRMRMLESMTERSLVKDVMKDSNRVASELKRSFKDGRRRALQSAVEESRQSRNRQIHQRHEGNRFLMQLLDGERWIASLR